MTFYNYCHIFERKRNSSTENIGKMEHLANFQQIFKGSYSRKYQLLRQSSRKSGWENFYPKIIINIEVKLDTKNLIKICRVEIFRPFLGKKV